MALTWRAIRREHRRAGSVNALLAPWGFVDDHTFITKAGHLGVVYRLTGIDYEGLDDEQRRRTVHQFEAALRLLDASYCVYQYLLKRPCSVVSGRQLYETELYLVLLYEGLPTRRSWREAWSPSSTLTILATDLDRGLAELHHTARAVETHLEDIGPARLDKSAAFRFFRRLVNDTDPGVRLKYNTHVDYFMADASIERHFDHLILGGQRVKVLTMKDAPRATFAAMLEDLYALPGEFIACLEWHRIPIERARRDIHSRRRHFFNTRISLANYISKDTKPEEMLVDESAGAVVAQLGAVLTEIEVHGHFLGDCSLTLVTAGPSADRVAAQARKILAAHDGSLIQETYNLLFAWAGIVPGNRAFNPHSLALLETNAADLSFLFSVDTGAERDIAGRAPLAVLATQQQTPYRYHLHVQDVGHTLVLGATGSGKTFLLNELATRAQQYQPRTVIFDLGHGYRDFAQRHGGSYLEFALDTGLAINPFALDNTPEHLHFLAAFCRLLIEGADGYRITEAHERELYEAVGSIYVLPASSRRLGTLARMVPRPLMDRLAKWTEDGRYGKVFDHGVDSLTLRRCQVFSFATISQYPELLEPLLFYVLHRVTAALTPDILTLCYMDEAWRFIRHITLRSYVEQAVKTWRQKNAAMILATQAVEDFASADLLRTVVESCPTALLLANPALDRDTYARIFHLNSVELDLLVNLRPRGQLLLKRQGLAKVLDLVVDPTLTNRPPAAAKKEPVYA